MIECKPVLLIISVFGLVGQSSYGFRFSGRNGVFGNPTNYYRNDHQFYPNPMFGAFYQNPSYGLRSVHNNNARRQGIINRNTQSQDVIIVFGSEDFKSEDIYPILNAVLNRGPGKETKLTINEYSNSHERPVTEQNFGKENVAKKPLQETVSKIRKQQHFQTSQEQGSGYSTTEPVAILGKPLVVSMIEFNPAGMDINTRSTQQLRCTNGQVRPGKCRVLTEDRREVEVSCFCVLSERPAQKQCVQDCQSSSSYRPVCGTNNVTYFNKEKFLCAQKCGINVTISKLGACS